jgi:hypothetical protein
LTTANRKRLPSLVVPQKRKILQHAETTQGWKGHQKRENRECQLNYGNQTDTHTIWYKQWVDNSEKKASAFADSATEKENFATCGQQTGTTKTTPEMCE